MKKKVNWYAVHEARMCLITAMGVIATVNMVMKSHPEIGTKIKNKIGNIKNRKYKKNIKFKVVDTTGREL